MVRTQAAQLVEIIEAGAGLVGLAQGVLSGSVEREPAGGQSSKRFGFPPECA